MPSGKVHSYTTVFLAAGAGVAAWQYGLGLVTTAALTGGALAGLMLTPDLDVSGGSISHQHARKIGGWWLGLIWAIIWTPYSFFIPHRSPLSHFPLLGTAIRLTYLTGVGMLFISLAHLAGWIHFAGLPSWWPWSFAGLALADWLHWILDNTIKN